MDDRNKPREDLDWRQQVHQTVERHKEKRRREQARIDDGARQLSIFPEDSNEDEGVQLAQKRRAEIRARVEEKLSRRQTPAPESLLGDAGEVSMLSQQDILTEGNTDFEDERGRGEVLSSSNFTDEKVLPNSGLHSDVAEKSLADVATVEARLLSGFIDISFVSLIQLIFFYLVTHLVALRFGALSTKSLVAMSLVGVVLAAVYFLCFWSLSGKTLGKILTRTRVVNLHDRPLGFAGAIARILGVVAALLPLGAGFIGIWSNFQRRAWHDRISGSKVVRD